MLARVRQSVPRAKRHLYTSLPIFALLGALIALLPAVFCVAAVSIMMRPGAGQADQLQWLVWASPMVLLLWLLYARIETLAMNRLGFEVGHTVRRQVIDKCQSLSIGALRGVKTSKIVQLLAEQIKWLEGFIAHSLPALTAACGVPAWLLMLLLCVDWRPFLIASAALALGFAMMVILGKRASGVLVAREKSLDAINDRLSDFVKGMPVIRACGRVEDKAREFKRGLEDMDAVLKASLKREIPLFAGAGCALELGLVLALMLNAGLMTSGAMAARTFVLATLLTVLIFLPALQQVGGSVMLRFARDAEKALGAFLSAPDLACGEGGKISKNNTPKNNTPKNKAPENNIPKNKAPKNKAPENNAIRFENVSFAYPGERSKTVLHNVSFDLPVGGVTAIVGPSGAGKSTLLNLLARFYDPCSGAVKPGGIDLRAMRPHDLLAKMAIVLQDEHIFNDTIVENIRVGRPDASDAAVMAAAKVARCHDFIAQFPQGYATRTGSEGQALSGGERQRIAIARAILKNAPIVVLDEASAAIDPINAAAIQAAIGALSRGRTLIVVAHHLGAIAQAQRIIVLNKGSVEAVGRHARLLQQSPTYRSLWEAHRNSLAWNLA